VGIAQHRAECINQAQVGRSTAETVAKIRQVPGNAQQVIVSVGSNDHLPAKTPLQVWIDQFQILRIQLGSASVTWILPNKQNQAREAIAIVAREHGDCVLDSRPWVGRDHVHPTANGYRNLAQKTQTTYDSNSCVNK